MLLKKIVKVILKVLNDPEINALIRSFLHSLSDEEEEEVKNELETKVEVSDNPEAR